jgi:hypothetical protein
MNLLESRRSGSTTMEAETKETLFPLAAKLLDCAVFA